MVKVKYIGKTPGKTIIVGYMEPGDIREVTEEEAEILIRGMFKIVKEGKPVVKKAAAKPKKDCVKCPKKEEE